MQDSPKIRVNSHLGVSAGVEGTDAHRLFVPLISLGRPSLLSTGELRNSVIGKHDFLNTTR